MSNNYVSTRIELFMYSTLSRFFALAGAAALSVMTVWIMIQGFLMVIGRTQEGVKDFIFKALRSYLIIAIATGMPRTSTDVMRGADSHRGQARNSPAYPTHLTPPPSPPPQGGLNEAPKGSQVTADNANPTNPRV